MIRGSISWFAFLSCVLVGAAAPVFGLSVQAVDPVGFTAGPAFEVTEGSRYIAVGDLNGDRFDDAVVVSPNGTVTAVLSASLGSFASSASFTEARRLGPLVVVDLDGDSILDVAVIAEDPGGVVVARGNGDGTFAAREFIAVALNPKVIAAADLDADSAADLVVAGSAGDVFVLKNRFSSGAGLVPERVSSLSAEPIAIAVADIDADGRLDAVILGDSAKLFVVTSPGEAGSTTRESQIDSRPVAMAVADYNRDNLPDVAILHAADELPEHLSLWLNSGAAVGEIPEGDGFAEGPVIPISCPGLYNGVPTVCRLEDLVAGSFNGDRVPDLAIAIDQRLRDDLTSRVPGLVQVFLGLGDGTLVFAARVNGGLGPQRLAVGELSGDQPEDLALTEIDPDGDEGTVAAGVRILRSGRPSYRPDGCVNDTQCATGHCVDGTCCTVAECPEGERCDIRGGECRPLRACGKPCFSDEHCESGFCVEGFCCVTPACPVGHSCLDGECQALRPVGSGGCNSDFQCDPPHCVDGACCEQAACEAPERCNVGRFYGVCTDPDSFGPQSFGKPCAGPSDCDPTFHCTDGVCCESFDCGPWYRCNVPGREGECAVLPTLGVSCGPLPTSEPTITPTPMASQFPTARPTDTPSPFPTPTRLPSASPTPPPATATQTPLRIADDGCAIVPASRSGSWWMLALGLGLVLARRGAVSLSGAARRGRATSPRPSPW